MLLLLRYLTGYLKIRVTGYSPERFLNLCKNKKIHIWGVEAGVNCYDMFIQITGFRKLKPILKKTKTKVIILKRFGLPFFFHTYRKRKLFFCGGILAAILIYSLTFFVWKIELEGNQMITDDVLMEYLESQNISHGMIKYKLDCEQISKDIRKQFDDIIWVSASVEGTCLFVHVKENTDTFEIQTEVGEPCDIIANESGIIVHIVTRSGVPQVHQGQEVEKGDILVSGTVDILNDAKEVVGSHKVSADADIIIERTEHYEKVIETEYKVKQYTGKKKTVSFVKFGNYTLHLGLQKHDFESFEQTIKENQLKLGENFYLPIYWGKKEIKEYKWEEKEYSKTEMETLLSKDFELLCDKSKKNNKVIIEKNVQFISEENRIRAKGFIMLQEETGIKRKIIDF